MGFEPTTAGTTTGISQVCLAMIVLICGGFYDLSSGVFLSVWYFIGTLASVRSATLHL